MRTIVLLTIALLFAHAGSMFQGTTGAKSASPEPSIVPGHSIAGVQLGIDRAAFWAKFTKKRNIDTEIRYTQPCAVNELHWLDPQAHYGGIFVFLRRNRAFQIATDSGELSTTEGIIIGSIAENVRKTYPRSRTYVLLGSGSDMYNGKDLTYIVTDSGMAFELYESKQKERRVARIFVFDPDIEFLPEGCIVPPNLWKPIAPAAGDPS